MEPFKTRLLQRQQVLPHLQPVLAESSDHGSSGKFCHQFAVDILGIPLVQADSVHPSGPGFVCMNQILRKRDSMWHIWLFSESHLIDFVFLRHTVCNGPCWSLWMKLVFSFSNKWIIFHQVSREQVHCGRFPSSSRTDHLEMMSMSSIIW